MSKTTDINEVINYYDDIIVNIVSETSEQYSDDIEEAQQESIVASSIIVILERYKEYEVCITRLRKRNKILKDKWRNIHNSSVDNVRGLINRSKVKDRVICDLQLRVKKLTDEKAFLEEKIASQQTIYHLVEEVGDNLSSEISTLSEELGYRKADPRMANIGGVIIFDDTSE